MIYVIIRYCFIVLVSFLPLKGWSQALDPSTEKTKNNGNLRILLAENWLVSDKHYDGMGELKDNFVEFGYYSSFVEVEYGVGDRMAISLYFPFLNYTYTVLPVSLQKQAIWKTGDAEVGITYDFTHGKTISVKAGLYLGLPLGFHGQGALQTGDGEFNQLVKLDMMHPVRSIENTIWWGLYAGFNNRTRQYAEEFLFGAEAGIRVVPDKVNFLLSIDGIKAIGKKAGASDINSQSLFSNFRERLLITPKAGFQINSDLEARIQTGIPVSGRNIFADLLFGISVNYQNKNWHG